MFRIDDETYGHITNWRRQQEVIPDLSTAIRRLLRKALGLDGKPK